MEYCEQGKGIWGSTKLGISYLAERLSYLHFEGWEVRGTGSGSSACCLVFANRNARAPLSQVADHSGRAV
jgi:hypothetical protein